LPATRKSDNHQRRNGNMIFVRQLNLLSIYVFLCVVNFPRREKQQDTIIVRRNLNQIVGPEGPESRKP